MAAFSAGEIALFQSTPSARRATQKYRSCGRIIYISIHALREEGDCRRCLRLPPLLHFNPRPPRGGRRALLQRRRLQYKISIHALREEGDAGHGRHFKGPRNFNPRPPRGGRRVHNSCNGGILGISIHALREEGDNRIAF